ncbi:MAG: hypothetical protein E6929_18640, partial [Clostridium sp.]|nr:hypothetical protein [Clostridium sp.]
MNKKKIKSIIILSAISIFNTMATTPVFAQTMDNNYLKTISISSKKTISKELLINGNFLNPKIKTSLEYKKEIPGWKTTASDGYFEIWKSGHEGVFNNESTQFLELNANSKSSIYQDFNTIPGQKLKWKVYHRGRLGNDTAKILIGKSNGSLSTIKTMTTGNNDWKLYEGEYIVPRNQTKTRLMIESVSASGNVSSVGNFISNVSITVVGNDAPVISGTDNISIKEGDAFDPMAGVTATDTE